MYGATTGSPTDSDHPKEKREGRTEEELGSDSSSTADSKIGFSMNDSPTFSKGLFVDSTDYSNKNLQNMSTNLSGVSLPEEDKRRGAQDILGSHFPAVETGKQKPNYRLSRDAHQDVLQGEALQSTGKHIPHQQHCLCPEAHAGGCGASTFLAGARSLCSQLQSGCAET